jgi:hypothetical protein
MAWYSGGTVTVTNGSATIAGAGTDFVSNAFAGDAFVGPDGRTREIARVVSATELTLAAPYTGASAGTQPYAIQPTQSYVRDLAQSAASLLATFASVRDGFGQGLIADGAAATPGIRFASDPDTGIARLSTNVLSIFAGAALSAQFSAGAMQSAGDITLIAPKSAIGYALSDRINYLGNLIPNYGITFGVDIGLPGAVTVLAGYGATIFVTGGGERARIDINGNLLAGIASGNCHQLYKAVSEGGRVLGLGFGPGEFALFQAQKGQGGNGSTTVLWMNSAASTGRSINAGGTINASGADYAEYMTKAEGCGTIAPGDVCGIDRDGRLTRTFADAHSFVVKSTDPAYVGGDSWAASLPPRPEAPASEPAEPAALPPRPGEDSPELEAWRVRADAFPAVLAAWRADHAAWATADAAYRSDVAAWEAALEVERAKVDRIAFCGQVPVTVTGDVAVGDYLVAEADGTGITAVAIAAAAITFDQYRRRLGKVWALRDGRPWVDVQHG